MSVRRIDKPEPGLDTFKALVVTTGHLIKGRDIERDRRDVSADGLELALYGAQSPFTSPMSERSDLSTS